MRLTRLVVAGLLLHTISQPAAAQLLDPGFTAPTSVFAPGAVYSFGPQQADGKRLVAGAFSRVNSTPAFSLVRLDANGALDAAFQQRVVSASNVYRVRGLAGGQYLLASYGGAIAAGGLVRSELLRLNADGSADASFNPGTGPLVGPDEGYTTETVQQPDGKIVAVGSFDTFNSVAANGVVRLNPNGSVDSGFTVGTGVDTNQGESVATVALQPDGRLLVGGYFSSFNGQPADGLVRLNSNGSLDTSFAPSSLSNGFIDGVVLQPDGRVLVYGSFDINGTGYSLARLNANGSLDGSFTRMASTSGGPTTYSLDPALVLRADGRMVVTGNFTLANGPARVQRLNADGSQDLSFQTANGPNTVAYTVGLEANGSVLLGGDFNSFNGSENSLGRLTSTGAPDPAFAPIIQSPGRVTAVVAQPDGRVIIGGSFTELNGQAVHRVARLSSTGTIEAGYSAATGLLPGPVTTLLLQPDGKVLAGTSAGIVRLLSGGSPDPSFSFPAFSNSNTYAMALQPDGRIVCSTSSISSTYRYLVRLTSSGVYDPSFARPLTNAGPGSPRIVDAIVVQPDGRIVVSGLFVPANQPSNQPPVGRVVRYLATGALDATFDYSPTFTSSNFGLHLYALALQPDGKLLVGGNFMQVNGAARTGAVRLNATGGLDASFAPNFSFAGTLYNLSVQPNGRILLGGSFSGTGSGASFSNLGRVLANGQYDASFGNTVEPNALVRSLAIQSDGGILVAGSFTTLGGQPAVGIARIVASNVLAVAAPAAVAARTSAWPVPAHGQLHVAPDASAHPLSLELLDALGRRQRQQPATAAAEQTLDLEGLPAGLYLLRVRYAAGDVTRRITVE